MQTEKLSALMDGELIDNELINELSGNKALQQSWSRYHLIRDSLRGDSCSFVNVDIAANVMTAIEDDILSSPVVLTESQPKPDSWHKLSFWSKVKPLFAQVGQVGLAASVALAVIVGIQQYNNDDAGSMSSSALPLNTFAITNLASPVSYGANSNVDEMALDKYRRYYAVMQNFELQRHLHSSAVNQDLTKPSEVIEQAKQDDLPHSKG